MDADLLAAYRRTTYLARTPRGEIRLRVGKLNGVLEQLLEDFAANSWALITAFNPGSQRLTEEENVKRERMLEEKLVREGLRSYPGEGVGDDEKWPPEKSVLVLSVSRVRAIELAREFGQNAILFGEGGGVPELLDCRV